MRRPGIGWILLTAGLCGLAFPRNQLTAQEFDMRAGMYLVVSDLNGAAELYEQVFQKEPYLRLPDFIGFEIGGTLVALFTEGAYNRELVRGNNVVPYIQVANLDAEFERIRKLNVRMLDSSIVDEGVIRLFMFADADGNAIEFFSVPPAPAAGK